jgi:hypothetical protein
MTWKQRSERENGGGREEEGEGERERERERGGERERERERDLKMLNYAAGFHERRCHEPRNLGDLHKLGKARGQISPLIF